MDTELDLLVRLPESEAERVQAALDQVVADSPWTIDTTGAASGVGDDYGKGFGVLLLVELEDPAPQTADELAQVMNPLCDRLTRALGVPVIGAESVDRFDEKLATVA